VWRKWKVCAEKHRMPKSAKCLGVSAGFVCSASVRETLVCLNVTSWKAVEGRYLCGVSVTRGAGAPAWAEPLGCSLQVALSLYILVGLQLNWGICKVRSGALQAIVLKYVTHVYTITMPAYAETLFKRMNSDVDCACFVFTFEQEASFRVYGNPKTG